ncbi:predicted protein [Chaetomium globosum CBS 148.51]|uniref:Uncharacterized protein n=1 Tax=Chaetomium globosum (strain ATCC 6205 / CBS 148.51 / DSM 1962 / NBRC 6347 / NRRL 1970) TaxID=306901 RepID=Q2H2W9_CHAGB|nr:uncharacterized protein CHGG_03877 [Chaetomium globosum CBS 148.51]EAQ87258.1 predicted protein [Chaetomium globosum CBS 148.51]
MCYILSGTAVEANLRGQWTQRWANLRDRAGKLGNPAETIRYLHIIRNIHRAAFDLARTELRGLGAYDADYAQERRQQILYSIFDDVYGAEDYMLVEELTPVMSRQPPA